MAINNLNPRRTVWFSPYEPSNKYDIWLSKNAHYDENGESTTDSNAQRDCDYIFKIYDCGKWNPIVGFNSTAANKINTVTGTSYQYTFDGESYTSNGKSEFDLPLFTNNSPQELFSAGPLGVALNKFVTDEQWGTIYDNHLKTIIEQYPFDLWPAESNTLGGIMMNTFPTVDLQHFSEIKYYNNSNKHPFADVSDIVSIINSGNAGTINGTIIGNENWTVDPNVLYRSFYNSPSIRKGWDETQGSTSAIKPRFELNGSLQSENRGKFLKLKDADDSWWDGIEHNYGDTDNCFDWVDLKDWFDDNYELNLASTTNLGGIKATAHQMFTVPHLIECKLGSNNYFSQGNEYKRNALHVSVQDIIKELDNWYASNESSIWDLTIQSNYGINTMQHTSVDDDGVSHVAYAHVLDHYTSSTKDGLYPRTKTYSNPVPGLYNGTKGLEWISSQNIVEEGLGISSGTGYLYYNGSAFSLASVPGGGGTSYDVLGTNNYNTAGNYVIGVSNGGTGGANRYLNGLGQWTTPPDTNTTYNDFSGSTHGLVPASTAASQDKYLKGDGTWGTPSVATGFNITMAASYTDDADFTLNGTALTSNSSNPVSARLSEWCYYNVDGGNKTAAFTFMNTISSGNAIYIRFNTGGVSVLLNYDKDLILSNISSSGRFVLEANSSYLFTIQFGIIKVQKIQLLSSISSDSE